MAFVSVLGVQNRSGAAATGLRVMPADLHNVRLRVDLGAAGNPQDFTDPDERLTLRIEWSNDNGITWINPGDTVFAGSPTRGWGRSNSPAGLVSGQEIPQGNLYPTHYRASYSVLGTVRFGVSAEVD